MKRARGARAWRAGPVDPVTGTYPDAVTSRSFTQRTLPSPFGPIEVAATSRGVVTVALRTTRAAVTADIRRRLVRDGREADPTTDSETTDRWLAAACSQLDEYFDGTRTAFDLPLDLAGLSAWDCRILEGVRTIPYGRTLGYGQVARVAGSPGAARAAGGSVSRNPVALMIPCHRVIAGDGTLGGYGGAWPADRDELLELKATLLAREGVHVARPSHAA